MCDTKYQMNELNKNLSTSKLIELINKLNWLKKFR